MWDQYQPNEGSVFDPEINKKVFFRAIQKYLSLYIFTKLSRPTNLLKRFVSNPENSKKLNINDVNPGITLNIKKISRAGSKYINVL